MRLLIREYLKYAYNNSFRYPNRLLALLIALALATFGILSLVSVTFNLQKTNSQMIDELENKNVNTKQLYLTAKTIEKPVEANLLDEIEQIPEVDGGYYFEEFSYYLWQHSYMLPWIKLDEKLNLELQPIMLDTNSAKEYGLEDKLLYGSYFTDNPNEIILSLDVVNRFINQDEVFNDNGYIILSEANRQDLKSGEGESINPEDLVGQTIEFYYDFNFMVDKETYEKPMYKIADPKSIELKIVGIYDPTIGYQTIGDAWLPLSLKESFNGLNTDSSVYNNDNSSLSGQIALKTTDPTYLEGVQKKIADLGYYAKPTIKKNVQIQNEITQRKVYQNFYQLALLSAIIISLVSLIVMITLSIAERKYDFTLQRTLGAGKKQLFLLFGLELSFIALIGTISGLWLTLIFLQSGLDRLLGFSFYLNGYLTLTVLIIIPTLTLIIALIQLNNSYKKQIASELAREG